MDAFTLGCIIGVVILVGGIVVVWTMAQNRDRDPATWAAISVLISPILAGLILLAMGKDTSGDDSHAPPDAPPPTPSSEPAAADVPLAAMEPVPVVAPPEAPAVAKPKSGELRMCRQCAAEVEVAEAERHGLCPNCEAVWP